MFKMDFHIRISRIMFERWTCTEAWRKLFN